MPVKKRRNLANQMLKERVGRVSKTFWISVSDVHEVPMALDGRPRLRFRGRLTGQTEGLDGTGQEHAWGFEVVVSFDKPKERAGYFGQPKVVEFVPRDKSGPYSAFLRDVIWGHLKGVITRRTQASI